MIKKEKKLQKLYLTFIDSSNFMASSLSNLANNLSEEIHKIKFKYGHYEKDWNLGN